jgi:endonuclease/exonuclease/phosphatase family metal-dependent hydrolase
MRLRLATFNLENLDASRRGVPLEQRIAVLRPQLCALDADVLCLQEVSAHARHDGRRALDALDRLLADTPYAGFARATTHAAGGGPADVHNLVVLSRWPIVATQQHLHDLVPPPTVHLRTTPTPQDVAVRWDRPLLEVHVELPGARTLVVWDAHLRAPLAAAIEGQKAAHQWLSSAAWAEGYLLATIKRVGQALELRHHVDRRLDADPDAWIVVAGDLNAGVDSAAYRLLRADVEFKRAGAGRPRADRARGGSPPTAATRCGCGPAAAARSPAGVAGAGPPPGRRRDRQRRPRDEHDLRSPAEARSARCTPLVAELELPTPAA